MIFALAVASAFDLSFNWALFGVGVSLSPSLARIVRAETLAVREETFIEASVAVGSRTSWILLRRVLPNIASPIIVQTTIFMGVAILAEAGLSILGVGLSPGSAAWGSMLSDSYNYIQSNAQNVLYPGLAIAVIVLAFNLVGDGLRDALGLDTGQRFRAKTRLGLTVVAKSAPIPATTSAATRTNGETGPPPAGPDVVLEVRSLTVDASTRGERVTIVADIGTCQ